MRRYIRSFLGGLGFRFVRQIYKNLKMLVEIEYEFVFCLLVEMKD